MAFESYDLVSLRNEVKTEFGISTSSTSKDSIINKAVNDAIRWIIRKQDGLWPWQLKDLTINVQPSRQGTVDVTQGSTAVTWDTVVAAKPVVPTSTNDREIVGISTTDVNLSDGFLVTAFADPAITIDAQYTGATALALSHSILVGYYILPEDYQRMRILVDTSIARGRVIAKSEEGLEWLRRDQFLATGLTHRYAVTKDPLPEGNSAYSNRAFLLIYPYPGERKTLRGKYTAQHQTLSADADIPLIPQSNRDVIFHVAHWRFAMKLKDASLIGAYKSVADEALVDMLRFYELQADDTEDSMHDEIDIGPVQGPPNLPAWRLD